MKKLLTIIIALCAILLPTFVRAADVTVSANIGSNVSPTLSTVTVSAYETLADPASHSILITVKLVDATNTPLSGLNVVLSSSRGQVDIIENVAKIGSGAPYDDMRKGVTDAQGLVSFKISSYIPGTTTINIVADQVINFAPINLQFDPLPFPANITIAVTLPFTAHQFIIYAPKENVQMQKQKLVNTGMEIDISFFWFFLFWILILLGPLFIIINYVNVRKVKEMQKTELASLQRIEEKEDKLK